MNNEVVQEIENMKRQAMVDGLGKQDNTKSIVTI
jgi:hypothetical protein